MADFQIDIPNTATYLNRSVVEHSKEVFQKFRNGLEWEKILPIHPVEGDVYLGIGSDITELLQPYQGQFTPKGSSEFLELPNPIRPVKIDIRLTEADLYKFHGKWASLKFFDPHKESYSFAQFLIDTQYVPKFHDEINTAEWDGQFVAPTAGIAGPAINSIDGFKMRLAAAVAANFLTVVPTGAITSINVLDKTKTFMQGMPEVFRKRSGKVLMAASLARNYADLFHEKYKNTAPNDGADSGIEMIPISGFRAKVIGVSAMEGSERMIFLPDGQDNMEIGYRMGSPIYPQFKFVPISRGIELNATIFRGTIFNDWRTLIVNDRP